MADDKTYSIMYNPKDVPSSGNLYQVGDTSGPLPYAPPGVVQFGTYPEPPEGYKQYQKADGEKITSYDVGTGPHPNVGPGMIPRGYDVPPPPPLRTPERTMRPPTPAPPSMQSAGYSRDYDRYVGHLDPKYYGSSFATPHERFVAGAHTGATQTAITKQFEQNRMQQGGEQYDTLESYAMDKFNPIPKMDLTKFQDMLENDFRIGYGLDAAMATPLAPSVQAMKEEYDASLPPQPKHSLTAARQAANLQAAGGAGYTPGAYPTPPTPTPPQPVASTQPARRVETDPRELGYNQPSRRVETDPTELGRYSKKEDSMDPRDSASSLYAYSKPKASFKSKYSPEEMKTAGIEMGNREKHIRDMPNEVQPPAFSPKTQEIINFVKTSSKTLEEGGNIDPADSDAGVNTFAGTLAGIVAGLATWGKDFTALGTLTNALGLQPESLQTAIDKAWFNANKNYFSSEQEAIDYANEMAAANAATTSTTSAPALGHISAIDTTDITGHEPAQMSDAQVEAAVAAAQAQAEAEAVPGDIGMQGGPAPDTSEFGGDAYSGGKKHGGRIRKYQNGTTDVGSLEPNRMDFIDEAGAAPPSELADDVSVQAREGDVVFPPESVEIMGLLNMNDMIKAALGLALEVGAVVPPDIDPNEKVPVRLTNGEVIIPKVVADAVGKERVEEIINKGLKLRAQREEQAKAQQQAPQAAPQAPQAAPQAPPQAPQPAPQGFQDGTGGIAVGDVISDTLGRDITGKRIRRIDPSKVEEKPYPFSMEEEEEAVVPKDTKAQMDVLLKNKTGTNKSKVVQNPLESMYKKHLPKVEGAIWHPDPSNPTILTAPYGLRADFHKDALEKMRVDSRAATIQDIPKQDILQYAVETLRKAGNRYTTNSKTKSFYSSLSDNSKFLLGNATYNTGQVFPELAKSLSAYEKNKNVKTISSVVKETRRYGGRDTKGNKQHTTGADNRAVRDLIAAGVVDINSEEHRNIIGKFLPKADMEYRVPTPRSKKSRIR